MGSPSGPSKKTPSEFTHMDVEKELIFAGMMGMIDPARAEVQPALEEAPASAR